MYILNHRYDSRSAQRCARHLISGVFTLALLLVTLVGAAFAVTPSAHAATSSPIIHWDASMIYPGQNKGDPWGPVGEPAVVHGAGFTAGEHLKLLMVAGDSNKVAAACKPTAYSAPYAAIVGQVTTSSSGSFDATFAMPGGLGQATINIPESICAIKASDNSVVSSHDDGPFTILAASKPTFSISANSVAAGGKLTVTGKNWVPAQPLNVTIANCADCAPTTGIANVKTSSKGNNSGTFSVTIPLPADAPVGNYLVNVSNNNGLLDANHLTGVGVKQLAITAPQVTPTPTVTSSPTVTVTASATATKSTANTTGKNNSSSGGSGPLLIVLLAIAAVILAIGGVLLYMYAQRQKHKDQTPNPPGGGQFQQYPNPQTPFPQGQFGAPPGYNPASGYNQNWQSNAGFGNAQGYNQNWQGNVGNGSMPQQSFQQFGQVPQQAFPQQVRTCARCGRPLAPNAANCVACGAPVVSYDYDGPDAPTVAY